MPYSIKMPDGQMLTGIPDNMDPQKVIAQVQGDKEQYKPTGSDNENFLSGIGSGLVDVGRKVTNFALPDELTPDWASDEAIAEQKRLDAPLMDTKAGLGGNILGATAASMPLGGAVGGGLRAARGGNALARTLGGSAPRLAASEGAVVGAATSAPGERWGGAALGGGLGGALGGLGALTRRGATGLVDTTPAARNLQRQGVDVPLALAAEPSGVSGAAKRLYTDILPAMPVTGSKFLKHSDEAMGQFRAKMLQEAVPPGARVNIRPGNTRASMKEIDKAWDTAYDFVNDQKLTLNRSGWTQQGLQKMQGLRKPVRDRFQEELKEAVGSGGTITGKNLRDVRKTMTDLGRNNMDDPKIGQAYYEAAEVVDDLLKKQLDPEDFTRLRELDGPWGAWRDVRDAAARAAKRSDEANFTPQDLVGASATRASGRQAALGQGKLQRKGEHAARALEKGIPAPGFWRTLATLGLIGGGVLNPAVTGSLMGGAAVLGSKPVQKGLMGTYPLQQSTARLLRKAAPTTEALGRGLRMGAEQARQEIE